jgi:hypothetical protein
LERDEFFTPRMGRFFCLPVLQRNNQSQTARLTL